jgi:hypothetical protein
MPRRWNRRDLYKLVFVKREMKSPRLAKCAYVRPILITSTNRYLVSKGITSVQILQPRLYSSHCVVPTPST